VNAMARTIVDEATTEDNAEPEDPYPGKNPAACAPSRPGSSRLHGLRPRRRPAS
jgi:hypothetical protein